MMTGTTYLAVICILAVLFLKYIFDKWGYYKLSWSLPGPVAYPLIGNAFTFLCDDQDIFERLVKVIGRYQSPMRFWLGPKFCILFSEAEDAAKIMPSTNFIEKDEVYRFMKYVLGEALISGSGPKWKRDRRLLSPLFTKNNTEKYFSCVCHHTRILLEHLEKEVGQSSFNVEKYMHRCSADLVNESIVGIKTNAQSGNLDKILHTVDRIYDITHARIMKVWLQIEWIFRMTQYWRDLESGTKELHSFFRTAITETEKRCSNGLPTDTAMINQILKIRAEHPDFASLQELIHHLNTLYTASVDTITTMTSFALLLLGMYPNIQNKIVAEIEEIIGTKTDFDLDDLSRMSYLEYCIKDVLRLFPVTPFIIRKTAQTFHLGNWVIPEGCSVVVSIHHIHRSPKYWEKPNDFYPEHFLPEAVAKRHPYAFLPFSAGPRGCIGKQYAYMAMKILLVSILQKYRIFADGKISDIELKADITVRPKNRRFPIRIMLRK